MKILLDCTFLRNRATGIDVTFIGLIKHLSRIDSDNLYIILVDHRYNTQLLRDILASTFRYKIIRFFCVYPLHIFVSAFIIPLYLKFKKIDVYHNPYFFGPFFKLSKSKVIITVHDLYYKTIPDKVAFLHRTLLNIFANRAINIADQIIVISSQTKTDFNQYYNKPQNKIHLVYQALNDELTGNLDPALMRQTIAALGLIEKPYILATGTILPSKGIDTLIASFDDLLKKTPSTHLDLVFAGNNATPYFSKVEELLHKSSIPKNNVKFLGYVSNEQLCALYSFAKIYVLASYYEGFGLTVLEAMNFDCPVVARNSSSIPEIVGDAALLFNTTEELSFLIQKLLINERLCEDLKTKGHLQVAKFSNLTRAQQTLNIYLDAS